MADRKPSFREAFREDYNRTHEASVDDLDPGTTIDCDDPILCI